MSVYGRTRSQRGFTLTEIAIVLGIIGLVLGAVWAASSAVAQNHRVSQAEKYTNLILQNYRSLYTSHAVDQPDATDITCTGFNSNFFPSDMIVSTICTTGTTATYPRHPWDNYVQVKTKNDTTVSPPQEGIWLVFAGLPKNACIDFAQALFGQQDVITETLNVTTTTLPPFGAGTALTASQISTACSNATNNTLQIIFRAR